MIRVLIAAYNFYPTIHGPVERFCRYAEGLRERGVQLAVVTPPVSSAKELDRARIDAGVPVYALSESLRGRPSRQQFRKLAVDFAIHLRPRPDVMQFFNIDCTGDLISLSKLRLWGIPSLLVNTMSLKDAGRVSSLRRELRRTKFKLLHLPLDRIVNSSRFMTDQYLGNRIKQSKTATIVNGVSLSRFRPADSRSEKDQIRRDLQIGGAQTALFVGNITPRKGVVELIKGWELTCDRGSDWRLLLVGPQLRELDKYKRFYQEWDHLLATSDVRESIEIRPAQKEIERYYRAADLFVFLSRNEGMPNVIQEAMASGLPILTARFNGFSHEFGVSERDYVLTDRDPESVASSLLKLMNDSERRARLAANGRDWVVKYHSVENSIDQYARLYWQIAGKRKGSGWTGRSLTRT